MGPDEHVSELRDLVGPAHVLTEPDLRAGYETDWTGRYHGPCLAVVRPGSTDEVAAVLRHCDERSVVVVPQGGNTGLVGGSVPRVDHDRPTIVLSLTRLDQLGPVDAGAMQVTAGAGVTLARWQAHARAAGLDVPLDFAARDSATVGGAIATDAGGSRVVRFGTMRQQLLGVEAVLAGGEVVGSLAGLPKETVGLHWASVLAGSEGTLAVVTAARLRVVPRFEHVVTAMLTLDSVGAAVELLARLRAALPSLDAVEFLQPPAIELAARHLAAAPPVEPPPRGTVVVVECADHTDPGEALLGLLSTAAGVTASAVADDPVRRSELLAFRDRLTEAINAAATTIGQPPFKLDVAVPVDRLAELLDLAQRAAADDGARLVAFGHLAEGNAHLNHLGVTDPERLADRVLGAVAEMGGTISAEHGVGVAKTRWLHLVRRPADLAAQRAIKDALDPHGILNPGVLLG